MRRISKISIYDVYCNSQYLYQRCSNNLFWVVSIAQLVEVMNSAELGGVAEVLSLNSTIGHKIFFSAFSGIVDLLYLSIFIINLYQFLILCSLKVLLL